MFCATMREKEYRFRSDSFTTEDSPYVHIRPYTQVAEERERAAFCSIEPQNAFSGIQRGACCL